MICKERYFEDHSKTALPSNLGRQPVALCARARPRPCTFRGPDVKMRKDPWATTLLLLAPPMDLDEIPRSSDVDPRN